MNLQVLSKTQIIDIYNNYMMFDFPQEELKPLAVILDLLDQEYYFAYGLYDDNNLIAYMYFCKNGEFTLLDYFAVLPTYRCLGYGSKCLELLFEKSTETGTLLLEVEDPAFAGDDADEKTQKRRIQFYINSGIRMTEIKINLYGIHMKIMYKPYDNLKYTEQQLRTALDTIYHITFTPEELKTKVIIEK